MVVGAALRSKPITIGLLSQALSSRSMSFRLFSSFVISPNELSEAIRSLKPGDSRIVPVSSSWYIPTPKETRTGLKDYNKLRIPNARFFDLDKIKDLDSPYPHMLPTGETFAKAMGELGIMRGDTVIVYDSANVGIFSGPRAAWTFKVFGHEKVHLLNNFKLWTEKGYETASGEVAEKPWEETNYPVVEPNRSIVIDFEDVLKLAKTEPKYRKTQILDARPRGRFTGIDPEPRPGLSPGHILGSISMPFSELIDSKTKTLKSGTELWEILLNNGVDPSGETEKVLMCGTGVTAAVIETALELAGIKGKRQVYDGSWTEWAQRADESHIIKK